jgi:hypothetical protein
MQELGTGLHWLRKEEQGLIDSGIASKKKASAQQRSEK